MDQWLQGFRDEHSLVVTILIAAVAIVAIFSIKLVIRRIDAQPEAEEKMRQFMEVANKKFIDNVKDKLENETSRSN